MDCSEYRILIPMQLSGDISPDDKSRLEKHINECEGCRNEYEEALALWQLMGEITVPEPSVSLRTGFYSMLADYKRKHQHQRSLSGLLERWLSPARLRPVFSAALLASGILIGYLLHQPEKPGSSYRGQIDSLSSQISEMKQVLMLSMLRDQSASRRIQAVSYTDELSAIDIKVTDALFTTLNEDPNVNVRLATLEALVKLAGNPLVREGLIRSIGMQDSPIMQSAIADVMVKLREKSSVPPLRKLLERKDLNMMVKTNIEKSIQQLI